MRAARMNVLIVGDYPPPYGGVSVQVSVLQQRLAGMAGIGCAVLDIGEGRRRKRAGCLPSRNVIEFCWNLGRHAARGYCVHLHTNGANVKSWLLTLVCGIAGVLNRGRTVVSLGSGSAVDYVRSSKGVKRALMRVALGLCAGVICRNEPTQRAIRDLGISPDKLVVLAGFYGIAPEEVAAVPPRVARFLEQRTPVISAIASAGPEYGISLVIEAAAKLRADYPDLGLVLIGAAGPADPEDFVYVTGELPRNAALGILQKADVFVRPTYFDGDASSVREALALGVPVVASDTDFRPDRVILFRRGDADDLAEKIVSVLGARTRTRAAASDSGSLEALQGIYEAISQKGMWT